MNEVQNSPAVPPVRGYWWMGYLVAVVTEVGVTALLRPLHTNYPFLHYSTIYFVIIAMIAYIYGLGPTVLAIVLGFVLFSISFVEPLGRLWPPFSATPHWERLFSFTIGAILIGLATLIIRSQKDKARHLANELATSNDRTNAMLDSITDAFFALDYGWRFTYFNHGAEKILYRRRDDLLGKNIWDELSGLMDSVFGEELIITMKDRVTREFEKRDPASGLCLEVRAYPSRDGISVYFRDTTGIVKLRMSQERQLHLLQQALAPPMPAMPEGWTAAAEYYPAYATEAVGGDFYDVFPTREGYVGILIGDVAGKGIDVASLGVATRNTIRAYAFGMSVGSALYYGNDMLCKLQVEETSFVTVLLILLDPQSGKFTYCSAGHPPGVISAADGSVRFLEFGDPPIGLMGHQEFVVNDGLLEPGDKIVLYTDGILEARRENVIFDTTGIEQVLITLGDKRPDILTGQIFAAARDWASGNIDDDATILVIERDRISPK